MLKDLVVAILWMVAIWRLPAARGSAIKRSLWTAIAALALALTVDLEPIAVRIDDFTGLVQLSTLLKHLIGILACAAVLDWVMALTRPVKPGLLLRLRYRLAVGTGLCLVVLFCFIPRHESNDFSSAEAGVALATVYLMVFEVYLGIAMATVSRMCWTEATSEDARRGFLRSGLWLLATGTALGVVYALARCALMTAELIEGRSPGATHSTTIWTDRVQALAIVLILLGTSVPAAEMAWRAVVNYRTLLVLRPLWWELSDAMPSVILGDAPTFRDDVTSVRDLDFRASRRIVEIRDARLLLREYTTDQVMNQVRAQLAATGLVGADLEAAVEACWLQLAVRAKARDEKTDEVPSASGFGGADRPSEINWLCRVTAARHLPAVRAAVNDLDRPRPNLEESAATV